MSNSVSSNTESVTYDGYGFATDPYVELQFTQRKVNRIRVATSEFNGQIQDYTLYVYNQSLTLISEQEGSIANGTYYRDHIISEGLASQDVYKVKVTVHSTKNPVDYARIIEVSPIYETDISDYVINYSIDRSRDLHETSLPIGGSGSSSLSLTIDNTTKDFNIYNNDNESVFGPYMKKDLKVSVDLGWRIKKTDDVLSSTQLLSSINSSASTIAVKDGDIFPVGGVNNYFVITIDPNTQNEEKILCSSKSGTRDLLVNSRGFEGTTAVSHSANAVVTFDPYEYVHQGLFYVDEWSGSSSMQVSVKANDWSKFLTEEQITRGFFQQDSTAGDAIHNLIMSANFSKADYRQLVPHSKEPNRIDAVAHYSFNEPTVDRSDNAIVPSTGLRARFWGIELGDENNIKNIYSDTMERELTLVEQAIAYDKNLQVNKLVPPSFVTLSKDISTTANTCLDLDDYVFTSFAGEENDVYYNGVVDGYYIPSESGVQEIFVKVKNGGVRVFLDNNLIINEWFNHEGSLTDVSSAISQDLDLDAGVPYPIRIEFFHTVGDFSIQLWGSVAGDDFLISDTDCYTVAAYDNCGSRDETFLISSKNANHQRNDGIYVSNPTLGQPTGIISETNKKSVSIASPSYIRIPNHSSLNLPSTASENYTTEWTIEVYAKLPSVYANDGEYLSNWSNASSISGFEFFNTSGSHGFKVKNNSGVTKTVSSSTALSTTNFSHIVVTYKDLTLKYYINGSKVGETTGVGAIANWVNDITIGGRGAFYTEYVSEEVAYGETMSGAKRSLTIDEFVIYRKALSAEQITNRYVTTKIQPLTVFPFLYGNEQSAREIIDNISLADFGRMYVDETDSIRYDHFYRFFESSIDQHANSQMTFSGLTNIVSGDFNVQLQVNKVTVNISGLASSLQGRQGLWSPEDPTTLGVVNLTANITASSNTLPVSSTKHPPFGKNGYLKIDNEVVKYTGITANTFQGIERAQLGTAAATHNANTKIREVRYYDIKYDKAPAFNILSPFITAIDFEDTDLVEIQLYKPTAYVAEFAVAASNNVEVGDFVYFQGSDPLTGTEQFVSIAGTPIVTTEQTSQIKSQSATLSDDIRKYGLKEIVIDNPYISSADHAKKIADFMVSKLNQPVPILTISALAMPRLQLGDRITIQDFKTLGIETATDYWVISHSLNVGDSLDHSITLRKVV
jgi:predicted nucleic acid-binding protein